MLASVARKTSAVTRRWTAELDVHAAVHLAATCAGAVHRGWAQSFRQAEVAVTRPAENLRARTTTTAVNVTALRRTRQHPAQARIELRAGNGAVSPAATHIPFTSILPAQDVAGGRAAAIHVVAVAKCTLNSTCAGAAENRSSPLHLQVTIHARGAVHPVIPQHVVDSAGGARGTHRPGIG